MPYCRSCGDEVRADVSYCDSCAESGSSGYGKAIDNLEQDSQNSKEYKQAVRRVNSKNKNNRSDTSETDADDQYEELVDGSTSIIWPIIGIVIGFVLFSAGFEPASSIAGASFLWLCVLIIKRVVW